MERFPKHRVFTTSSGKIVLGGKNAEQNEDLVNAFIGKDETILHTEMAGSPFCVILNEGEATNKDIEEASVFCAAYSRDWKKHKRDVEVHIFSGKNVHKEKDMKVGTFGVNKEKKIIIKKEEVEHFRGIYGNS